MWNQGIPPFWRKEFDAVRAQRPTSLLKPRLKKRCWPVSFMVLGNCLRSTFRIHHNTNRSGQASWKSAEEADQTGASGRMWMWWWPGHWEWIFNNVGSKNKRAFYDFCISQATEGLFQSGSYIIWDFLCQNVSKNSQVMGPAVTRPLKSVDRAAWDGISWL